MTDFDLRKRANLKDSKVDAIGGNTTLVFPIDMEKKYYPEAIKFSIYERGGVSYDKIREPFRNAADSSANYIKLSAAEVKNLVQIEEGEIALDEKIPTKSANFIGPTRSTKIIREERQKALDDLRGKRTNLLKDKDDAAKNVKQNLGKLKNNIFDESSKINEELSLEKTIERHKQSIYLQMPDSVSFSEAVEWTGTDVGLAGGLKTGDIGKNTKDILEYGAMGNLGTLIGGAAGGVASMLPGVSGIASSVIGAALGEGSGLQAGINNALNVKTNPFKEQTFQGIGFRPFEFSFVFRPRSEPESFVVDNIVRAFRQYSKPTFHDTTKAGFFKYPHEFRIEFLTIDENNSYVTNEYIPEIKFCICNSVNVNFSPNGWRSFEDGAPQTLELQLSFQETELITGEDVLGNTEVGRFKDYGGRF